jgi:hypothetical protein
MVVMYSLATLARSVNYDKAKFYSIGMGWFSAASHNDARTKCLLVIVPHFSRLSHFDTLTE